MRPRLAVDAAGAEGVVDVARGQNPGLERERAGGDAGRVAAAAEPLVMVADEPADAPREAELSQQRVAPDGVPPDDLEFTIVQ